MNLARSFKAGKGEKLLFWRRVATVDNQSSLARRNIILGIGNRGLKATAKIMPTLRVEELNEFLDTLTQTVIQRAPQATIPERVARLKDFSLSTPDYFEKNAKVLHRLMRELSRRSLQSMI